MATIDVEMRLRQFEERFSRRLANLEEQISNLRLQFAEGPPSAEAAWWKKIVGVYQDDPEFEEAMRLGREYRESLRPKGDDAEEPA